MSLEPRIARSLTAAALTFALATSPFAASPPTSPAPQLVELDEVVVTAMQSLPLETYVAYPEFDSVAISPDGTRLAMSWTEGSYARLLTVSEFPSMKTLHDQQLQTHMGATDLQWAGNRFLLAQPDYPRRGYLRVRDPIGSVFVVDVERRGLQTINTEPLVQAMAGDPLREHRLEREARERNPAGAAAAVAGRRSDRESLGPVRVVQARIGSADKSLFQTIWGANRAGSNNDGYGAFELDLPQFRQSRVATLPLNDGQLVPGPESRIALATGINEQNEEVVYYLPPEVRAAGKDWQLRVSSRSGERGLRPIVWSGNGEEYYALDGRGPTRAVVIWNAVDNTQRVLHRNPGVDMDHFAQDPAGTPWVFSSAGVLPVHWYPDAAHPLAQLHQRLVQRLPGEQVDIVNASDDLSIAVARVSSGRRPPVFLVMDVKTAESLTGMHSYTRLRATRLAVVEPFEVRASDGLVIQGSLTTPTDIAGNPRRGLPLLVIARAGPSGQPGSSGYEFERQLFASRGFAVLQVYPRGSRGRGVAFERAGDGH